MKSHRNDYNDKFKHTLQHLAREWYHGLDMHQFSDSWHEFNRHFSRYFSTQGRNIKHLHERWRAFSFDPITDDIKEYIRDVREAAKQLGHGDDAVLNLLKATMPTELYGTLYGHDNLYVVMTMLKDIYAKKPQNVVAAAARVAQGASAPFTLICSPTREGTKAPSEETLEERLSHLTDTLYCLDLDGKPVRKPFKPFITQPRRRFKGGNDRRNFACGRCFTQSDGKSFTTDHQGKFQTNRGCFRPRRPFRKFDRSPTMKRPRVSGRPFNKDKIRCFGCKEFDHMQKDCPELNKPHKEDHPGPKKFEDYTYTHLGPDVQPQMQINPVLPGLTNNYDQALGVIKDSINTANPLASLNL